MFRRREDWEMRSVVVLLGLLMASTVAQTQTPSQDDIVRRTREALETAQEEPKKL